MRHTVIVGSYNRPRYVGEAIRSVISQDVDLDLIVSDDASNDETLAVIHALIDGDARCRLLAADDPPPPGPRRGANIRAARRINAALREATGDVIHYLADDDMFAAGRFGYFDSLFANPAAMVGYGGLRYIDVDGVWHGQGIGVAGPVTQPHCALDQSQVAHRRSCLERCPEWRTDPGIGYTVDGLYYTQLVAAGYGPIWPIDNLVSYKRQHALCMSFSNEPDECRE